MPKVVTDEELARVLERLADARGKPRNSVPLADGKGGFVFQRINALRQKGVAVALPPETGARAYGKAGAGPRGPRGARGPRTAHGPRFMRDEPAGGADV